MRKVKFKGNGEQEWYGAVRGLTPFTNNRLVKIEAHSRFQLGERKM